MNQLKNKTRTRLLDLLRQHEPISRNKLARLAKVSSPTVTNLMRELITEGIVKETGRTTQEVQGVGRPSELLELEPQARVVLGVHLGAARPALGLVDLRGNVIESQIIPRELVMHASTENLALITQQARALLSRRKGLRRRLLGVGIGIPNIPHWDHTQLTAAFKPWRVPVLVDRNVRAMTLGEFVFGYQRQLSSMVFVDLGYGIGSGIIVDGKTWAGATGRSGELGHIKVTDENIICRCGNPGCLEAVAGESAIVSQAHTRIPELAACDGQEALACLIHLAQTGNSMAMDLLQEAGYYIGLGLADMVNIVNPQLVVFGGPLADALPFLLEPIQRVVHARSQSRTAEKIDFQPSRLGSPIALIGAATQILMRYFYAG